MDLDALIARQPADRAGRRTRPHQRARQPPSQALSRRRGTAVARHRRLYRRQHPAHRKPQRRRRADHPCAGARDRAGFGVRPRRRDRADRPHAGRSDPAPEGGQGLCAQAGRARAGALLLAGQSDRVARAGAAPHRRARRRAVAHPHAGQCHRRPLGGRRAHPGLRQRGSARRRPGALHQAAGRPPACAVDRDLASRRGAACNSTDEQRDRLADTLRLAEALGGEALTIPGGAAPHRRRRHRASPTPTTSPRSSSASRRARAGSRSCAARWCTIWCAAPAISAST